MKQIKEVIERFKSHNNTAFRDFEIEGIEIILKGSMGFCERLSMNDKVKAYSYLYKQCEFVLDNIAKTMNYQLEYEPTDEEIWDFVEEERKHIDINSDNLSSYDSFVGSDDCEIDESTLYEYVIDKMREQYEKKNADASEWCDKIQIIANEIYTRISAEKDCISFFKQALKETGIVKTNLDEYLTCDQKKKKDIKQTLSKSIQGKKGKDVSKHLIALHELGYINIFNRGNKVGLYEAIKKEFSYNIGTKQGVNDCIKETKPELLNNIKRRWVFFDNSEIDTTKELYT